MMPRKFLRDLRLYMFATSYLYSSGRQRECNLKVGHPMQATAATVEPPVRGTADPGPRHQAQTKA